MAENKKAEFAERIEKLIVDGQKEVLQGILQLQDGQKEILDRVGLLEEGQKRLVDSQNQIIEGVRKIDKKHDTNTIATHDLMQDVKKDVAEVKEKLEVHLRIPHMA